VNKARDIAMANTIASDTGDARDDESRLLSTVRDEYTMLGTAEKEVEEGKISVRSRDLGELGSKDLSEFVADLLVEINSAVNSEKMNLLDSLLLKMERVLR